MHQFFFGWLTLAATFCHGQLTPAQQEVGVPVVQFRSAVNVTMLPHVYQGDRHSKTRIHKRLQASWRRISSSLAFACDLIRMFATPLWETLYGHQEIQEIYTIALDLWFWCQPHNPAVATWGSICLHFIPLGIETARGWREALGFPVFSRASGEVES